MRVWSVDSQKGGSGKTTLVLHLGVHAASEGLNVLIIDLDPQDSAERWSRVRELVSDEPAIVRGPPQKLPEMLRTARRHGADLVLVDTPPQNGAAALAAAKVADVILVPCRGSILDLQAIGDTKGQLSLAGLTRRASIVLNALPTQRGSEAIIREVVTSAVAHGLHVMPARLSERTAFSQSLKKGKGVTEDEPNGQAAKEIRGLYQAICERQEELWAAEARRTERGKRSAR